VDLKIRLDNLKVYFLEGLHIFLFKIVFDESVIALLLIIIMQKLTHQRNIWRVITVNSHYLNTEKAFCLTKHQNVIKM